jgi:trehalose 6-phosphate phosphatase
MQYALSPASLNILTRLSQERTLYAFDFDGTLSPIVEHPALAGMRVRTRKLLDNLAELCPCAIVSGRARADLLDRLSGVRIGHVIGNHGAEPATPSQNPHHRVARWKSALALEINSLPGVWVEDKGMSLAVHYRQAPEKAEAHRRILAAARNLERVKVFGGKLVVNLAPDDAPDKGEALVAERDRLGCDWVLYVGDDENDEDAFALDGNIVPVRIGQSQTSHARYYLRSQAEIDQLLELLVLNATGRANDIRKPVPA